MLRKSNFAEHQPTTVAELMAFLDQYEMVDHIGPYTVSITWTSAKPPGADPETAAGGYTVVWSIEDGGKPWPNGDLAGGLPVVATPREVLRQYFGQVRHMLLARP
jgi:hypothetical protein